MSQQPLSTTLNQPQRNNSYSTSRGLAQFLAENSLSFAFTAYDSGLLYLIGSNNGKVGISFRQFSGAMGLCYHDKSLYLASGPSIHRLENIITRGETSNNFDAVFISREQKFIGDVQIHEIAIDANNDILFANTRYSCVGKIDKRNSFSVVWKPEFISRLAPEDRCHLNGFALRDGKLAFVSVIGHSDVLEGWRVHRTEGGRVIDIADGVSVIGLSMPHSPRWYRGQLWFLDSGLGIINGAGDKIFCPGFLRGLSFFGKYALVTVSLPRDGIFNGLALQKEIEKRGGEAWCGVLIIDIDEGNIVDWIRINGETRELFDCVFLPCIKCPNAIAPGDPSVLNRLTF